MCLGAQGSVWSDSCAKDCRARSDSEWDCVAIATFLRRDVKSDHRTTFGATKPEGLGHTPLGWVHPAFGLGFEVVASTPMDGTADSARMMLVQPIGESATFRILSLEDMIADRMGQYASGTAREIGEQAAILLALYPECDRAYLDARIRDGSLGDYGIDDIPAA